MQIIVDFRNTVVYKEYPTNPNAIPNAVDVLQKLTNKEHKIFCGGKVTEEAIEWFKTNKIDIEDRKLFNNSKEYMIISSSSVGSPTFYKPEISDNLCLDWYKVELILLKQRII